MTPDVIALRAHLVAEAEQAKRQAVMQQRIGEDWRKHGGHGHPITQRDGAAFSGQTRESVDAWLAADARLRALDGLIAAAGDR